MAGVSCGLDSSTWCGLAGLLSLQGGGTSFLSVEVTPSLINLYRNFRI